MKKPNGFRMEFHVSRAARDRYQFGEGLFATNANVIFTNFHAARQFAQKINARRDLVSFPEQAIRAGQINAMGLIDEILHMVVHLYRQQHNPQVFQQALVSLNRELGQEKVDQSLRQFIEEFPPVAVYQREIALDDYLDGKSTRSVGPPGDAEPASNRELVLEEMLLLWLANSNPAFSPFLELFDDGSLKKETAYLDIIDSLKTFFDDQPTYGPDGQNLVDMLRSPAIAVPHSLSGQLEYIRQRWGMLLGKYLYRLLTSLDLIKEEEKATFMGPGPARVLEFGGLELEAERFSPDKDWMPSLVLIAKNTYVWLDQLSKKYKRSITQLDQIPGEELDLLAQQGFSGLWLIGLWERSAASQRIKQLRGNPEAVASAYSLYDYSIAGDLGGEQAYNQLRDHAWQRGIRLASDMVPNHMGIDSAWVMDHPDWFVALDYSPFPSYTFNGPNLSADGRVSIYLEDHYFDNTDAAVVFKRVDTWSGSTKYIYHGNDGTSMPWNDTAQLNYLMPEVREAVIQTILNVARRFPIIRFDAAMTLAKKHYQRLWFPEPGTGGAIPSRAEQGLTKEQFDALMPVEFWREVVDRVAQEVPDTLLLAEAFWLMEGYFVRTLGMHRVYNSAFMNMLRDEKNAEYRLVIKNTLEFDPEILKRYVNFMNNPDERTAVDQFGKGDKYFGICVLMSTLPGLPMFGHGQIEGFTEKYGMEFRRAYWEETSDPYLVERHQREVFPLLRKRYLFAEVNDFLLYDLFSPEGYVVEDVFAYSNRSWDNQRSLVLYNNRYSQARGWIRTSSAISVKSGSAERNLIQKSLGEGLGISNEEEMYTIFRDQITGMEYIRSSRELAENGMFVELDAYRYHVFLDFRQMRDNEWHQYANLASYLAGRGVPSIEEAMREIFLQPVHYPFRELINPGFIQWVIDNRQVAGEESGSDNRAALLKEAGQKSRVLLAEIKRLAQGDGDVDHAAAALQHKLAAVLELPALAGHLGKVQAGSQPPADLQPLAARYLTSRLNGDALAWGTLLGWLYTHRLGEMVTPEGQEEVSRSWIDEWLLGRILTGVLENMGVGSGQAGRAVTLIKLLIGHQNWHHVEPGQKDTAFRVLQSWLRDGEVQSFLGINRHQGILWFNRESFEELLWWMFAVAVVNLEARAEETGEPEPTTSGSQEEKLSQVFGWIQKLQTAEEKSDFQVEKLLAAAKDAAQARPV